MRKWAVSLGVIVAGLWLNNTSAFTSTDGHETRLIAHRGVHQIYAGSDRNADTCRAQHILPADHAFIENTLPSMQAAFDFGADVVELDVHLTTDKHFAVLHDWTLDCQTDGSGVTNKHDLASLKALDVGYGFTSDGEAFPMRGAGIGLLSTLTEVLEADTEGRFLVNFKSNRKSEGEALASLLKNPAFREKVFGVYGGDAPTAAARNGFADLPGFGKAALKRCLLAYAVTGWTGWVHGACANRMIGVPVNIAPYLWGWPHKFTQRMKDAGTEVILWGPYDGSGFSSGFDAPETLKKVPAQFDGYVWTNRIEIIGPLLKPMR